MRCALLLLPVLLAASCSTPRAEAVYVARVIHTMDPENPYAEAIAVREGRILGVGTAQDTWERFADENTRRVELGNTCIVPGLIDAHGHLAGLGALTQRLDVRKVPSYAALVERVTERAASLPADRWIDGRGWDQADWGEREMPSHEALSAAVPDHPVVLTRVDGHAVLVNARAMELAGIDAQSDDPVGGEILRDARGEPTGMLIDNAIGLVTAARPDDDGAPIDDLWLAAQDACFRAGLTSVHDAGVAIGDIDELQELARRGRLQLRVHVMLSGDPGILTYIENHPPEDDPRLAVRAVKLYADGALGSRGAWLLEDYTDRPGHRGLAVSDPVRIRKVAEACVRHGYQLCTHAIGDRGNREVLDAYARALGGNGSEHRFRVEHAQCIHPADIPRFRQLGVIASMQPTHATSDMRWAEQRVGTERIRGCYAWRRLLDTGAHVAFGSDFPVESERPLWGLYAAITRQDHEGNPPDGWLPGQRLDAEEALRLFTREAAYAAFREDDLGSLEPGKLADFVVLSHDILDVEPEQLLETRVLRTVIDGREVFRAER